MEYIELSLENLAKVSREFAEKVAADYQPDLVVFIAKGGYIIGRSFSAYFACPLVSVTASRQGGRFKEWLHPLLRLLPEPVKLYLRKREVASTFHQRQSERLIVQNFLPERFAAKRILLLDDSVDTGATAQAAWRAMAKLYPSAHVKFAALNVFSKSGAVFAVDYYLYRDTILKLPGSVDSREYKEFLRLYEMFIESADQ